MVAGNLYETFTASNAALPLDAASVTTRYLCAAAHLRSPMLADKDDPLPTVGIPQRIGGATSEQLAVGGSFARQVLRGNRIIDLVYGADAGRIIEHCHAARRQIRVRDTIATLIVIVTGLVVWIGIAIAVLRLRRRPAWQVMVPLAAVDLVVAVFTGGIVRLVLLAPVAGVFGCWLVFFGDEITARSRLRRLKDDLAAPPPRLPRLLRLPEMPRPAIVRLPDRNVLPYESERIVGAGLLVGIRTITIAVDKPSDESAVRNFQAHELLDHIADHIAAQGRDQRPTHGIPRLDVALVMTVPAVQWEKHVAHVSRDAINYCADKPPTGARERAYVCARSTTWDGQAVVSVFVHVALEGRYLRVSVLPHLLPPIVPELQIVDRLQEYGLLRYLAYAAVDATAVLRSIGRRIYDFGRPRATRKPRRRVRKEHLPRSELISLREAYAQGDAEHFLQREDVRRIIDFIQTRTFNVTGDFLTEHGIDTAEFKAQVQYILNNSVVVNGSGNVVQNVSGDSSTATNDSSTPPQGGNP